MNLPTKQRIREHFLNYLDANLGDMAEDFIGIEVEDDEAVDNVTAVEAIDVMYTREGRFIINKLHEWLALED